MTDSAPVKTDADGIPLLENAVTPQQLQGAETAPGADLTDQEQVERLLAHETVQVLLGDLAEDLQKLVAWKVEEALKQELEKLVREAAGMVRTTMFLGIAFTEALALIGFVLFFIA